MGNAKWTGVKLKDILEYAGEKRGSKEVSFNGLDVPPMATIPDFQKSLSYEHAIDGGETWQPAKLGPDLGKYSWRRWHYTFSPTQKGDYKLYVKATNAKGETQPMHQWNHSGYMRNEIEILPLKAE